MIVFDTIDDATKVSDLTLSAVFDFVVMTDYDRGQIFKLPTEKSYLTEDRPLYKFLTGRLEELKLKCGKPAFEIHYGPISSGLWEAGVFDVLTYGERILNVIPRTHYKKRGSENRLKGMDVKEAINLVEKLCGTFSISYSTAYCIAVEKIAGISSEKLSLLRILGLELERVYNHIHSIYRLALAASQKVAVSHLLALEEDVLRLNYKLFGHRYGFGFNRIGSVKLKNTEVNVNKILKEFEELVDELSVSKIFIDRLHGTAKISSSMAVELDTIGVAAKASGLKRDVRAFSPFYEDFEPVVSYDGDSLSRTIVRFEEVKQSLQIIIDILDSINDNTNNINVDVNSGEAISFVESPPGDLLLYLKVENGRIKDIKFRGASEVNYLSFAKSVEGNIFTDYPFALESFGLSFADASR